MAPVKTCPECGLPLTPDAPEGLCRACLLKCALGGTATGFKSTRTTRWTPPTVEELGARFPELDITQLLGRGGMGAVYQARQKNLERFVALKILPPEMAHDPDFAGRFVQEAQAMARLNHPHIVTIHEFGDRAGLYYFLMEYVDGTSLRSVLDTGHISPREALAIVPQICEALQYAHDQGIVHRDIKPENILLNKQGQVKIADFGLAKLIGKAASQDASGEGASWLAGIPSAPVTAPAGTPAYMAPEQREHPAEVDHRADIYALGVVFYQMLTGELPAQHLEPPSRKVQIDVRLDEIVLRALESSPDLRFQNATQLKTEVETVISTPSAQGILTPRSDLPKTRAPRRPSEVPTAATSPTSHSLQERAALAIAVCLAVVMLLFLAFQYFGHPPRAPTGGPLATVPTNLTAAPETEPSRAVAGVLDPEVPPPPAAQPPAAPPLPPGASYTGADLEWENFENGCTITRDGGQFHIAGATTASGWGHTNGIRTTTTFPDGDFTVSVDFKEPLFNGDGSKLTYLRVSSDDGNMVGLLYQPGSYQLQRWTPRAFAGAIRSFGDETTTFHRLTLKYESLGSSLSGWVDDKPVGTISATLSGRRKVWLDANADAAGSQIDLYFANLTIQVGANAAQPVPGPAAGAPRGAARLQFHLLRPTADTTSPCIQLPDPRNPKQSLQLLAATVLDESALAGAALDPDPAAADPASGAPGIDVILTPAGAAACARIPLAMDPRDPATNGETSLYAFLDGRLVYVSRAKAAENPARLILHIPPPASRAAAEEMVAKLKTLAGVSLAAPATTNAGR